MKKILFITTIFGSLSFCVNGQDARGIGAKTMTIEEAIKLNGTANPTITVDGKKMLYSEYAAQQRARLLQTTPVPEVPDQFKVPANPAKWGTTPVKQTTVQTETDNYKPMTAEVMNARIKADQLNLAKKQDEMKSKMPVNNAVPVKPVQDNKPIFELPKAAQGSVIAMGQQNNRTTIINTDPSFKQSPSNNVKPVPVQSTGLGTQVDPAEISASNTRIAAANNTITVKPVIVNNVPTGSTINLSVGAVNDAMNAVTPPGANTIGLMKVDNTKHATITEVPASVVNPVTKVPAATNMQGTEKAKTKE